MTTALARRFKFDVSADNTTWINVKGINDLNPQENPTTVGADTYDTNGFNAFEKTMTGWSIVAKALRSTVGTVFDPGQELVRTTRFAFGTAARLYVRWYDRNGAPEAYSGQAIVDYAPAKTGVADLDEITMTFKGDGILAPITNPYAAAAVPVLLSATPSGASVGQLVTIVGSGFTGVVPATGVKFGAVTATVTSVQGDTQIVAVMPAGTAGAANVTVTNPIGVSTALAYVRGA
jgi:hypothetical protein